MTSACLPGLITAYSPLFSFIQPRSPAFQSSSFLPHGVCESHSFCLEHASSRFCTGDFLVSIRPHLHIFPTEALPDPPPKKGVTRQPLVPITSLYFTAFMHKPRQKTVLLICLPVYGLSPSLPPKNAWASASLSEQCCVSQHL